jgi:nitrogen fixation NifU-like protein
MMTEVVTGKTIEHAKQISKNMQSWIEEGKEPAIPENLQALEAVRHHPARKKCVMLAWHALIQGMEEYND